MMASVGTSAFGASVTDVGVVYGLSSTLVGSTSTRQTYDVTLTANTTGYTGTSTDLLDSVAIKVDDDSNVLAVSGLSLPAGWTFLRGGISGSGLGCKMSGNGFDCAQGGSVSNDLSVGSHSGALQPYTWVFQITLNSGTLFSSGASIKAQYLNGTDTQQTNLTSVTDTNTIVTPEPESWLFLITVLVGACIVLGRTRSLGLR
jgi:hypothetical protein